MGEVVTDGNLYLQGLLAEIEQLKSRKRAGLYRINDMVADRAVLYAQAYFKGSLEYVMDARKCARCTNKWDIIITFKIAP